MNSYGETTTRRAGLFYRDADRAVVGGVCAGLASHFGLNLKVTRFLMILAFLMAMPFAVIAYLGAVLLIPAESRGGHSERFRWNGRRRRARHRRCGHAAERAGDAHINEASNRPRPSLKEVRDRYKSLDRRLAELERQVTSPRFELEQQFRNL
jgi:phage shock protein C